MLAPPHGPCGPSCPCHSSALCLSTDWDAAHRFASQAIGKTFTTHAALCSAAQDASTRRCRAHAAPPLGYRGYGTNPHKGPSYCLLSCIQGTNALASPLHGSVGAPAPELFGHFRQGAPLPAKLAFLSPRKLSAGTLILLRHSTLGLPHVPSPATLHVCAVYTHL